jgi:hypothetical protein
MIAGLYVVDRRSALGDDACVLMPEHHRQGRRPIPVHDVLVTHTNAGCLDPHSDLSGFRRFLLEIENLQGSLISGQNHGTHVPPPDLENRLDVRGAQFRTTTASTSIGQA